MIRTKTLSFAVISPSGRLLDIRRGPSRACHSLNSCRTEDDQHAPWGRSGLRDVPSPSLSELVVGLPASVCQRKRAAVAWLNPKLLVVETLGRQSAMPAAEELPLHLWEQILLHVLQAADPAWGGLYTLRHPDSAILIQVSSSHLLCSSI